MFLHFKDLKVAVKIGLALAAVALVAIGMAIISLKNLDIMEDAAKLTAHTHQVLAQVENLTTSMVNQETGLRGYLI